MNTTIWVIATIGVSLGLIATAAFIAAHVEDDGDSKADPKCPLCKGEGYYPVPDFHTGEETFYVCKCNRDNTDDLFI